MRSLFLAIPRFTTLRVRLLLLVLVAALPTALLLVISAHREKEYAVEAAKNRLRHTAALAANDIELPINGSRYALTALASNTSVRGAREPACSAALADVLRAGPRYTGFAVLDRNGVTQCGTTTLNRGAAYGDREPFRQAVATRELAVGKPAIGRGSGKAVIPIYLPLLDAAGEVERVIATALDLHWVAEQIDQTVPEITLAVLIFDRDGTVYFRYPDDSTSAGTASAGFPLAEVGLAGTLQAKGLDGVDRLYAVAPPQDYTQLGLAVAVGMPVELITGPASRAMRLNLLVLALVTSLALAASWLIGDLTVRRRIAGLVEAAERIGRGGRARAGRMYGNDEFGVLARAFDDMADSLERQVADIRRGDAELTRVNRTLRTLIDCNQALVKMQSEQALLQEICRVVSDVGGYRMAWVGYAKDNDAKSIVPMAWSGHDEGFLQETRMTWADAERGRSPTGAAIRTGALAIARDIARDPRYGPWREAALARGYASSIALPLESNGRAIGALAIYADDPDAFGPHETELFLDLAGDLSYGITALRLRVLHAQADEALRQSEQRLRLHFQQTAIGVIEWDTEFRVARWNPAAETIFGYTEAEALGRHASFIVPESARAEVESVWRSLLRREGGQRASNENVRKNGETIACEWYNTPLVDAQGTVAGVASLVLDVTERKRAEEEILRLNADLEHRVEERTAELEASRRELEDLYNQAPCGYHSLDPEGRYVRVNDTELGWLGYGRDEVVGRMSAADILTAESLRTFRKNFPQFKETGRLEDLELDLVRKDGTVLSVSLNATAVRDADGRFLMSRSTMTDIGARKQIESEINRLNRDLRERATLLEATNKELESFSYSVSHDLRAPLRAVDGFSQILEEDHSGRLDAEGRETIATIRQSTQHMGQLIDDLLAFSRLGRTAMNRAEVDMGRLAHEALEEACGAAVRPRALTIEPLPTASGDRALLQQVWRNLAANAVKFSSKAPAPEIHIFSRMGDSGPVYCMRDNGAGFDMRYYDKLFGVFQRLHTADEYPGTGVGLAIVQRIVARHRGRVWAESKLGEGASFYFWLPREGRA